MKVDIGILAHNEADAIARIVETVASQSILDSEDVRILVLSNGSTDATVANARKAASLSRYQERIEVVDLQQGGKSRTWNVFVHDMSRPDADSLIFCDSDIAMPAPDLLQRLVDEIAKRPALDCMTSRPIKDIAHGPRGSLSMTERLIGMSGGTLDDWRTAVCGQLYVLRSAAARTIHLPIGLPVEDGFVRAMLLTHLFAEPENLALIDGREDVFHVYPSERTLAGLIRHQTRIVIGGAINAAVFAHLSAAPRGAGRELEDAAGNEQWLVQVLANRLPTKPYGWVPLHFLLKRAQGFKSRASHSSPVRKTALLMVGLGFDLLVYVNAQVRMARGAGVGYW
jgi:glycosyltransferase involved in cell wall biosynthesis